MEEEQSSRKTRRSWKQSNISSFEVEEEDDVGDGEVERAMGVGMESQFVGRWHAMLLTCADYMPSCLHAALGKPSWKKKCFLLGIARKGGGGGPCPNFLTLFSTMLSLIF